MWTPTLFDLLKYLWKVATEKKQATCPHCGKPIDPPGETK